MREDVCIVLNEGEPKKAELAQELEAHLQHRGVVVSRLKPESNLIRILRERAPKIVVLDFLLGEKLTAFDVMVETGISSSGTDSQSILWTDEPSIHVAVSAMKLGAIDYIEMQRSDSMEKIISAVIDCLDSEQAQIPTRKLIHNPSTIQTVGQTPSFVASLAHARSIAARSPQLTIILGARGTGRSHMSQDMHLYRSLAGRYYALDLDTWPEPLGRVFGGPESENAFPLLSYGATVFIDHSEVDHGVLLQQIGDRYLNQNNLDSRISNPMLVLGTSDEDFARSCLRLFDAEIITIPELSKREEDIFLLLNHFAGEVPKDARNDLPLTANIAGACFGLSWPGNVRQLRAVAIEALSTPQALLNKMQDWLLEEIDNRELIDKFNRKEQLLMGLMLQAKRRWEEYACLPFIEPEAFLARTTLDSVGWDWRLAAARLGTTIPALKQLFED